MKAKIFFLSLTLLQTSYILNSGGGGGSKSSSVELTEVSPLWLAAQEGRIADVQQLLDAQADPNNYKTINTPLHVAMLNNHTNVVEALLQGKASVGYYLNHSDTDPDDTDPDKDNKFHCVMAAAANGVSESLTLLLQAKADPNAKPDKSSFWKNYGEDNDLRALDLAAIRNKTDIVNILLAAKANVIPHEEFNGIIKRIARNSSPEIFRIFFNEYRQMYHNNLDYLNILFGDTMAAAFSNSDPRILEIILNAKANPNECQCDFDDDTANMPPVCFVVNPEQARQLLAFKANFNQTSNEGKFAGKTLLEIAQEDQRVLQLAGAEELRADGPPANKQPRK